VATKVAPRVLVVDDDPAWIELIGQALHEVLPAAVVFAADGGDAALARVADEEVDLVLLDLDMPGVDGREVLERLSGVEPSPSVVVVSGSSRGRDVELCRSMASGHVSKPDTLDDLVAVLRRIVAPGSPEPVPPTRVVAVGADVAASLPREGVQVRAVPDAAALGAGDLATWADCAVVSSPADAAAVRAAGVPAVLLVADEAAAPGSEHDVLPLPELSPSSLKRAIRHAVERAAFDALLQHQVQHDPLTSLPTRSLLVERLGAAVAGSAVHGTVVGVCVVDLDGFRSVNERFGRDVGDQVLVAVGDRLRSAVRPSDTVARIGGTRFAVCCESLEDAAVLEGVAVRVAWALHAPVEVADGGVAVPVTAAVGTATTASVPAASAESLLAAACRSASPRPPVGGTDGAGAEERLVEALEELDLFAYAVAHDLRSPLASLGSLLDLLERSYGPALEGDGREWVRLMRSGIGRMTGVVDGLVSYRAAGSAVPAVSPVDLGAVVRALLPAGVTVTVSQLPVVLGDEVLLADVVRELLGNAVKFGATSVRVGATRASDGSWVVHVDDDGIGVPAEQRDRVLAPFRRLHGVDAYPGAGAGLAVAARLAARMGGRVWLADVPGAAGCRACFSIPAA